ELRVLARYHFQSWKELDWLIDALGCFGTSDLRERDMHSIRLAEISKELGESQFQNAIRDFRTAWEELWQFGETMRKTPCEACGTLAEWVSVACEHRLQELSPLRNRVYKAGEAFVLISDIHARLKKETCPY